ncbi:MAG: type II toxin-antitoxin system mRNA interferase toxin, RelE/StbE family [Anaerovoracaceae bacterium]
MIPLAAGKPLLEKHRDHALSGEWEQYMECHISSDWLLIHRKGKQRLIRGKSLANSSPMCL